MQKNTRKEKQNGKKSKRLFIYHLLTQGDSTGIGSNNTPSNIIQTVEVIDVAYNISPRLVNSCLKKEPGSLFPAVANQWLVIEQMDLDEMSTIYTGLFPMRICEDILNDPEKTLKFLQKKFSDEKYTIIFRNSSSNLDAEGNFKKILFA